MAVVGGKHQYGPVSGCRRPLWLLGGQGTVGGNLVVGDRDRDQILKYILEVSLMRFGDGKPRGYKSQRRIEDDTQVVGTGALHWVGDRGERGRLWGQQRYQELCFSQVLYLSCFLE